MNFSFSRLMRSVGIIALLLGSGMIWHGRAAIAPLPASRVIPPNPTVVAQLPDGAYMHFLQLPLGDIDGALVGSARFEPNGRRAAFVATFPGATLGGDWRSLDPSMAFLYDPGSRTLSMLPTSGNARTLTWYGPALLKLTDASGSRVLNVGPAAPFAVPPLRMAQPASVTLSDVIGEAGDGRVLIARNNAGRYAALQVGARSYRFEGIAPDGDYAFVGNFVAWVDRQESSGQLIQRTGTDALAPPSFAGSAYGDALEPVLPLGHGVYQGNYRDGSAYFTFTYGMRRIVAATRDLQAFTFPALPAKPEFTVGDGFGSGNNGRLYFARPEDDQVTYWRSGRYVREALQFPAGNGKSDQLFTAMESVAAQDPLWPPLRPDEDALDQALVQWRIYPVGDALGERWIASYLGRVMLSDAKGVFHYVEPPRYPFAILSRTDDGRLWGAAPLVRTFDQGRFSSASAALWWTRDGVDWHEAGRLAADPGAVGLNHDTVWVALTEPWLGRAEIVLLHLGDANAQVSGGTYRGEQLFFAQLENGFYLLWGATPGRRLGAGEGTLSAYRIDADALARSSAGGMNAYADQLLQPARDPSLPAASFSVQNATAIVQPTLARLQSLTVGSHATLATNVADVPADPTQVSIMSFEQERAYEIKYGARPYPLATVSVTVQTQQTAVVHRWLARGELAFEGSVERWQRDDSGVWHLSAVLSRF